MRIAVNIAVFYAAWIVSVLAASAGWPVVAASVCAVAIMLHLAVTRHRRFDAAVIGLGMLIGLAVEGVLMATFVTYASPGPVAGVPPAWIVLLWAVFATTLNVSLVWLKTRLLAGGVLAAVGGPQSYVIGERLGAITIAEPRWLAFSVIAMVWAFAFPVLLWLARFFERDAGQIGN